MEDYTMHELNAFKRVPLAAVGIFHWDVLQGSAWGIFLAFSDPQVT